jgi:hypothetical protein
LPRVCSDYSLTRGFPYRCDAAVVSDGLCLSVPRWISYRHYDTPYLASGSRRCLTPRKSQASLMAHLFRCSRAYCIQRRSIF